MTNLSLNRQNRLFSCLGIGLLIGFLVFHLIKISFVIPEACVIIFNTASLVNKFMKQGNKKIKNIVYVAAHAPTFFFFTYKDVLRNPRFVGYHCLVDSKHFNIPFFFNIDFLFRYFINLNNGEAVLNIIAQASGFTKLIFMGWKTRNLIPEHENNRFWLLRDKFVIYEAVLNIIVQATAFARVFFSTWRFKKWKSNWLPGNWVFLNHPSVYVCIAHKSRSVLAVGDRIPLGAIFESIHSRCDMLRI